MIWPFRLISLMKTAVGGIVGATGLTVILLSDISYWHGMRASAISSFPSSS